MSLISHLQVSSTRRGLVAGLSEQKAENHQHANKFAIKKVAGSRMDGQWTWVLAYKVGGCEDIRWESRRAHGD